MITPEKTSITQKFKSIDLGPTGLVYEVWSLSIKEIPILLMESQELLEN